MDKHDIEDRLRHVPTRRDKIARLNDVLRYAAQDLEQTLLPDGLLKDIEAILPTLKYDLVSVEEILHILLGSESADYKARAVHDLQLPKLKMDRAKLNLVLDSVKAALHATADVAQFLNQEILDEVIDAVFDAILAGQEEDKPTVEFPHRDDRMYPETKEESW